MPHVHAYLEAFKFAALGRRAFVTKEGSIGLAYASVDVGDEVYLFAGGRVPFVLRKLPHHPEALEIYGECFLDGAMLGEMVSAETEWAVIDIV